MKQIGLVVPWGKPCTSVFDRAEENAREAAGGGRGRKRTATAAISEIRQGTGKPCHVGKSAACPATAGTSHARLSYLFRFHRRTPPALLELWKVNTVRSTCLILCLPLDHSPPTLSLPQFRRPCHYRYPPVAMASQLETVAQLLQATLDPRQHKQGK